MADPRQVAAVRAFNRFYTRHVGALGRRLLASPWTLTEARVLYELAQAPRSEVTALRRATAMDAGQLSRVLTRLERQGLVAREPSAEDGRRQVARLTGSGRAAFDDLDRRSGAETAAVLDALAPRERRRLVAAMEDIRTALDGAPPRSAGARRASALRLRPLRPGDLGWIVERHGALYAAEYGWDGSFEALVARIVADFAERADARREAAWIAEADGRRAGCVLLVAADARTAQLRLLLVEPFARGRGAGGALIDACLAFARAAGYREITLWTNDVLAGARRLYERAGFALREEAPHTSFGHDLVGQHWSRAL